VLNQLFVPLAKNWTVFGGVGKDSKLGFRNTRFCAEAPVAARTTTSAASVVMARRQRMHPSVAVRRLCRHMVADATA
jgi:hypothetical protein